MSLITLPIAQARAVTVVNDTLFGVAARELGDAAQWTRIAKLNGLTDPWIAGSMTLLLPPLDKKTPYDGVLA
jgi:nucleoid-associated protein YgaU